MAALFPRFFSAYFRSWNFPIACLLVGVVGWSNLAAEASTSALVDALVEESQKHLQKREINAQDALYQAELQAAYLASDVSLYCTELREVCKHYARRGEWRVAETLANKMAILGHPIAYVDLVEASLTAARKNEAEHWMQTALGAIPQAAGREREEMKRACAISLYHLGKQGEARALSQELQKEDRYEVEIATVPVVKSELPTAGPLITKEKAEKTNPNLSVRFYLAWAKEHLERSDGSQTEAEAFLTRAGELASIRMRADVHPYLLEVARMARLHGLNALSQQAERVFLQLARGAAPEADWKALHLAQAAAWLAERGATEEAKTLSKESEKAVEKIHLLEAPQALLKLALLHQNLKQNAKAEELIQRALQIGMQHPHPRARALTAMQACLHYAQEERIISAECWRLIQQQREAHED